MARYNYNKCRDFYDEIMMFCTTFIRRSNKYKNVTETYGYTRKQEIKRNNNNYFSLEDQENDVSFPLDAIVKEMFERAFEQDFSQVIIHIGKYSDDITRQSNALAITRGTDIYFRSGMYSINSEDGLKLLAHELQHVTQYLQNKRLSYKEDIEEAEEESEIIEEMMDVLNIHNIKKSIFHTDKSNLDYNEIDSYTFKDNKVQKDEIGKINKLLNNNNDIIYKLSLKDNKSIYLTQKQKTKIINEVKNKISEHINNMKNILPENDFDNYLLKFLKLIRK